MKLFIAMPCIRAMEPGAHVSLLQLLQAMDVVGIAYEDPGIVQWDSFLPRARARIAARFMSSDCTHALLLDDDLAYPAEQALRLILSGRHFSVAIAPVKEYPPRYAFQPIPGQQEIDSDGWVQIAACGLAFACLSREVLELLYAAHPELCYEEIERCGPSDYPEAGCALFDGGVIDGRYREGDHRFCDRWRKIGGQIWADTRSIVTHIGPHSFHGNFQEYLKPMMVNQPTDG